MGFDLVIGGIPDSNCNSGRPLLVQVETPDSFFSEHQPIGNHGVSSDPQLDAEKGDSKFYSLCGSGNQFIHG